MPNVPTMALLKYCTQLKKIDVCIFYLMPDSEKSYCVPYHFFTASIRINLTIQENVVITLQPYTVIQLQVDIFIISSR